MREEVHPTMTDLIQLQPRDEHNRALEANVRPPDWVNPTPSGRYNLVVLGAGTAGLVTAAGAAGPGAKVALIERELMGGDCLNVGCVPSKGIISAGRVAAVARRAAEFGVQVGGGVGRLPRRHDPDAAPPGRDQPQRLRRAVPGPGGGRLPRAGPLRRPRQRAGGRSDAALQAGRHRHRRPGGGAAHPGPRPGRLPDERVG
jgi:hypothetical protein